MIFAVLQHGFGDSVVECFYAEFICKDIDCSKWNSVLRLQMLEVGLLEKLVKCLCVIIHQDHFVTLSFVKRRVQAFCKHFAKNGQWLVRSVLWML